MLPKFVSESLQLTTRCLQDNVLVSANGEAMVADFGFAPYHVGINSNDREYDGRPERQHALDGYRTSH